jgi:hypothetical protein
MRQFIVLSLALAAVLVLGTAASPSAWAVLLLVPEFSLETLFKGTSGLDKIVTSSAEIHCESSTSLGLPQTYLSGEFTIELKSCGKKCHSEGATEGVVAITGEYELVTLKSKDAGILFLGEPVTIQCESSTKVEVQGDVLGLLEPINTKTTKFTINLKIKAGKQEFTEFEDLEGTKETAKLEASVNGGAFNEATEEEAEDKITTALESQVAVAPPWVRVSNAGGGAAQAGRGFTCLFTAVGQNCEIQFTNNVGEVLGIVDRKLEGRNSGLFEELVPRGCVNGNAIAANGNCREKVKLKTRTIGRIADFCIILEKAAIRRRYCAVMLIQ